MRLGILLIAMIGLAACTTSYYVTVLNQNAPGVKVEFAITPEERQLGLMHREQLDWNAGMLFFFEDEAVRRFWMKNTLIPLDIIYINSNLEIVAIQQADPCEADPCDLYPSDKPAMYVLEVNKGWTTQNGVEVGQQVQLPTP